ncbi:MAG: ATP-grasp fold amidoligase family protein, partial [Rhodobacterales bacterium]|nr:ATP-grasp fold amidoligase family protein [Rhodobacterales bacterium]
VFKFFGPITNATPSDKLRSAAYTPLDVRHLVHLPKRCFISSTASLPDDGEIAPGSYFFKSNHGSGTNQRVTFPMEAETRSALLKKAAVWLTKTHNEALSLWWYETMARNVYIEEDLGSEVSDAPDWKFFVCNGRVEIFQVDVDRSGDHVQTLYDRNGEFLPHELYFKSGNPVAMPAQLDNMIQVAEGIGRNFDFIRVDMFLKDGVIYLGEIGLVPNGASTAIRSREIDERLGGAWSAPWLGQVGHDFPSGHYDRISTGPDSW